MGRRIGLWAALGVALLMLRPLGCTRHHAPAGPQAGTPIIRVRLLISQDSVALRATTPPTVKTATEHSRLRLNVAPGAQTNLVLTAEGWQIGGVSVPGGRSELTLTPSDDASVTINDRA